MIGVVRPAPASPRPGSATGVIVRRAEALPGAREPFFLVLEGVEVRLPLAEDLEFARELVVGDVLAFDALLLQELPFWSTFRLMAMTLPTQSMTAICGLGSGSLASGSPAAAFGSRRGRASVTVRSM